jgi:hypothetical protein
MPDGGKGGAADASAEGALAVVEGTAAEAANQ